MFSFTSEDVVRTLKKAPNLNSAVKNFLKRQARPGDEAGRFAKNLRDALSSRGEERALLFIDHHTEKFAPHLLAIGAYAHSELVDRLAGEVVQKYADTFNETYQSDGESLTLKDEKKFVSIMSAAVADIQTGLSGAGFEESEYLRAIVLNAVFEQPVLKEGVEQGILPSR